MKIITAKDKKEAGRICADMFEEVIREKEDALLGLATGSTPIGLYDCLSEDYSRGRISMAGVHTINLDEYVGLGRDHEQSFGYFMDEHLFSRVNIPAGNIMLLNGLSDPRKEIEIYESFLAQNRIDILILGIGNNGHIGFNEPEPVFRTRTHLVDLTPETIEANARFFTSADEVPKKALTMGMGGICAARKICLAAFGAGKADAISRMLRDDTVDPMLPCSVLKLCSDVTVIIDQDLKDHMR